MWANPGGATYEILSPDRRGFRRAVAKGIHRQDAGITRFDFQKTQVGLRLGDANKGKASMSKTDSAAKRVLVAEDETLIRLDIVETLTAAGYDVIAEAADGQEAIDLALELEPDVCVLDVKMPKVEGITAAEEILKEIPAAVVMLTAYSQKELVQRAAEVGATAYVTKPFGPSDLIPAVEIALSRQAQIEALESEIADMTERFETRKRVDRAKGLLIERMGLSEPEAFRWIQKTSMDRRLSMREVADAVIDQVAD